MTSDDAPRWKAAVFGNRDEEPRSLLPETEPEARGTEALTEAKPFAVPSVPRQGRVHSGLPPRAVRNQRRGQRSAQHAGIPEWHAMDPAQRQAAWPQLVSWVIWLHDRYELSVETRLPRCWSQHPGLIEELWALKVWREEIYGAKGPSGQAARYWHNELRQLITSAVMFYSRNCRSGHKSDGVVHAATSPEIRSAWSAGDPLAGIPAHLLATAKKENMTDSDLFLTASTMAAHLSSGRATPMSGSVTAFASYGSCWWKQTEGGWVKITDVVVSQGLDFRRSHLAEADARVAAFTAGSHRPAES
jgi:hypothetical protein